MPTILEQAQLVSAQSDWSSATYHLQQLLESEPSITDTELAIIIDLALTILARGDFQERWDIAKIIPKLGYGVVTPLIAIWEDVGIDPDHRWYAAKILGNFPQPEVIISLVNVLSTTEIEDLKEMAALTLAGLEQQAIAPLVVLLADPQSRLLATRALAQIRRPEVIEPLLGIVKDENVVIRATAIETLASFRSSRIPPVLIEALEDLAASVRKEAVIGLGARADLDEDLQLVERLAPLLHDLSVEVCQQTAIALGKFSTPRAATVLFETLQSPYTPLFLQLTIIQVLAWSESESSLNYLQQAFTLVTTEAKVEIIRVLGRIATENLKSPATSILIDCFQSQAAIRAYPELKQALAHSLGQLKTPESIPILLELAKDPEMGVRLHAINALNRINNHQENNE
ncbi:HEAT repeat domain-containing protein [Gloeocapsa sp. PCC 73106]|uniref:HEAT repeat domain-containing protein n=1 Tax=Gloeocapsa sp. PCC 73106 TaxID=102232 RepID=UPI0002AC194F|nr:HEAT repeat domain-containing protein [Gloeocapsa sp. PCC 73106]ELR98604.1 HEAT repeat-containing protein [Gloeocapsa sp. PCC 73106]